MNSLLSLSSSQLRSPSLTSKSTNLQSLCQRRFALTSELAQIAARGLAREAWIWGLPVEEFINQCARSGQACFSRKSVVSFKSMEGQGLGENCSIIIILEGKLCIQTKKSLELTCSQECAKQYENHYLSASECVRDNNQIVISETDTVLLGLSFSQQLSTRIQETEDKWIGMLGRNSVLSSWNKQKVKELLRNSKMKNLRLGETLLEEGDTAECAFFVLRGAFSAQKPKGNNNDSLLSQSDNHVKKHILSLLTLPLNKVESISRNQISPFILCRTEDSESDHGLCSSSSCRFSWTMKSQDRLRTQEILRTNQDSSQKQQKPTDPRRSQKNLILSLSDISEFSDFERKKKKEDNSSESSCSSGKEQSEKGCDLEENRGSLKVSSPCLNPFSIRPRSKEDSKRQLNLTPHSPQQELQVFNISEGEVIGDEKICCLKNDNDTYRFKVKCASIEGGLLLEVPRSIINQHYSLQENIKDSSVEQKISLEKKLAQYNRESFPKGIAISPDFNIKSTSLSTMKITNSTEMRLKISENKSPSLKQFTRSETSINLTPDNFNKNEDSFLSPILIKSSKTQLQAIGQKLKQTNSGNIILEQSSQNPVEHNDCNENMQNNEEQRSTIESEQKLTEEKKLQKGNQVELSEDQFLDNRLFLNEDTKQKPNIRCQINEIFPACMKQVVFKPSQELRHYAPQLQIQYPVHKTNNSSFSHLQTADSSINSILKSQNSSKENLKQSTKQSIETVKYNSYNQLDSNRLNKQTKFHKSLLTNELRISLQIKRSQQNCPCSSSEIINKSCNLKEEMNTKSNLSFNESLGNNTKRNQWKQLFSPQLKSYHEFDNNEVAKVHRPISLCMSESLLKKYAVPQLGGYKKEQTQESLSLNKSEKEDFQDQKQSKALHTKETTSYERNSKRNNNNQEQIYRARSLGCFNIDQMVEDNQNREIVENNLLETENIENPFYLQEKETDLYKYRTDRYQGNVYELSEKLDNTDRNSIPQIQSCPAKQSLKVNFNWKDHEIFEFDDSTCKEIQESNCNKMNSTSDIKLNAPLSPEQKTKCIQWSNNNNNSYRILKDNQNSTSNRFSKSSQQQIGKLTMEATFKRNNRNTQDFMKIQKNTSAINRIFNSQFYEKIFN